MTEVSLGELGGRGLCGCKIVEGDKELVVYCSLIYAASEWAERIMALDL